MTMLDITRTELQRLDALSPKINSFTQKVMNAIPFDTVPDKMKAVIAISHITSFAGQFRRNIRLIDGTSVPINAISFIFAASGAHKDSANNAAKKCFAKGYEKINEYLKTETIKQAIATATAKGEDDPELPEVYREYLHPIPPLFMSVSTAPGLIQHINDIGVLPMGASSIYTGEFSDELAHNQNMLDCIKVISETFDLGVKEATYTKGVEFRNAEINGQSVSALFIGSPGHVLYDESTKKKFHVAFMSKLARRSWFCYAAEKLDEPDFADEPDPLEALYNYRTKIDLTGMKAREAIASAVDEVTDYGISTLDQDIEISEATYRLFEVYRRYNNDLVNSLPNQDTTYSLIRRHLQWKALKLAGAYAFFSLSNTVEAHHYIDAIRFCELLDHDMTLFEQDINKLSHERFSDYVRSLPMVDNKISVSVHDIKKLGLVSNITRPKLQELVTLCAGYDSHGIYTITDDGGTIQYEPVIKTDIIGVSFKPIDCTQLNQAIEQGDEIAVSRAKQRIAATTAYGFEVADTSFSDLGTMLENDFAYSPFRFRNGVRGKDNILGGTKWLVLDVDTSVVTASEAHFMLSDINHYVALSSDPNNEYKYRVLIELDSVVTLSAIAWKHFYLAIAEDLGLRVDPLPQSQIFFSYAGRPVMSNLDTEPLVTRDYVMAAIEKASSKEVTEKSFSPTQRKALLADSLETFNYLFECPQGVGSRNMIRAAYHARDLGASLEYTLDLIKSANDYWVSPMDPDRLDKILDQVTRMFNN
jgi:hypothetical protein